MSLRKSSWVVLVVAGLVGNALAVPPLPGSTLKSRAGTGEGKILGSLELRPSLSHASGAMHTENVVAAGYKFPSGISLVYKQEFNTNLYNPALPPSKSGLNPYAYDGSLRAKWGDLWSDADTGLSLSYETRLYLPTYHVRREAGMILAVRNYLRLKKTITPDFAISLEEVPIIHGYSRSGTGAGSKAAANPSIENRIYLAADWATPIRGLKLYFPIIFQSTKYRDYAAKAKFNDQWEHWLWIYPELTYAITPTTAVGLAYRSSNLVSPDFKSVNLAQGFQKGVTQVILQASL
jgi:hypothetical protein